MQFSDSFFTAIEQLGYSFIWTTMKQHTQLRNTFDMHYLWGWYIPVVRYQHTSLLLAFMRFMMFS